MRKFIFYFIAMLISLVASAQTNPMHLDLPIDPNVRYGKLDNGLTYYIRHNKYPDKRADFYIAQQVGSMQEEDNQAGLAHFLEHMAFNGTKHYSGRKTMLNYLETIGAKFGANVNAYTGFDETVYTLKDIPVVRETIIDSCLLILHDWSSFLELTNEEIDKERPIIKEEWRTRSNSNSRIWDKQLPVTFAGSKYADRMPIGKMEVVEFFDHQVLRDYYHKWYRPDLQAVIIVGDIDVDQVEAKIKTMFADIPKPINPAERVWHPVPDNKEPIVSIVTDKEESISRIIFYTKHDILPREARNSEMAYMLNIAKNIASSMLAERLGELSKDPESPFSAAFSYDGHYFVSKTKDAWTSIAISKEGKELETVASLIRETERVKRYGFTDSELERAKANLLNGFEQTYNNRDKQQNNMYTQEYVRSFNDAEPFPGVEYEFELMKKLLPQISTPVINSLVEKLLSDENNVFAITAPEKEGLLLPTNEDVLKTISAVRAETIEGYMEEVITKPLISEIPQAGSIVKEEIDETLGLTIWTLSNGMRISIKPTEYKNDEVIMSAMSYGGTSNISDGDMNEAQLISLVPMVGGIGNFNSTDLKKVLAGKSASVNFHASSWTQGASGRSSIKDLETLLQLTYLHFTAPRKDEGTFGNLKMMIVSQLKNREKDPETIFGRQINIAKYGDNPRHKDLKAEDAEKLDYDKIIALYKQIFANSGTFVFTFTGNVDKETLKPLVETYLASLPTGDKNATYKKLDDKVRRGTTKTVFEQEMEDAKTSCYSLYTANIPYTQKNRFITSMLKQVLDIVYVRTIRETEGGTYGVSVGANIQRIPANEASLVMEFDTNPDKVSVLAPMIQSELDKIVTVGPELEDFQKVKEYLIKKYEEDIKTNGYWSTISSLKLFYGEDSYSEALSTIKSITREDIQTMAKEFTSQGNKIEVIMNPKK